MLVFARTYKNLILKTLNYVWKHLKAYSLADITTIDGKYISQLAFTAVESNGFRLVTWPRTPEITNNMTSLWQRAVKSCFLNLYSTSQKLRPQLELGTWTKSVQWIYWKIPHFRSFILSKKWNMERLQKTPNIIISLSSDRWSGRRSNVSDISNQKCNQFLQSRQSGAWDAKHWAKQQRHSTLILTKQQVEFFRRRFNSSNKRSINFIRQVFHLWGKM